MSDTRTLTVSLVAEVASLKSGIKQANAHLSGFQKTANLASKAVMGYFGAFAVASTARAAITGIVNEIKQSTQAAMEFELAFSAVEKTVNATERQFAQMQKSLVNLSVQTGESATSLFEAAGAAGQTGISTENIVEFTRVMSEMAVASNLTSEEAAIGFAKWANITGLTEDKISNLTSAVVGLGNSTAANEAEILNMSVRFAGIAKTVGMADAAIAAYSATLIEGGLNEEAGGSAFGQILTKIAKAVSAGTKDLRLYAALAGQSAEAFKRLFNENSAQAVLAVAEGFKQVKDSGGNALAVLEQLGVDEIRQAQAMQALAGNAAGLARNINTATMEFQENNARAEEAAKRYETASYQVKQMQASVTALRVEMAGAFMESLSGVITQIKEVAEGARVVNSALESTGGIIGSLGKLIAALGKDLQNLATFGWGSMIFGLQNFESAAMEMAARAAGKKVGEAFTGAVNENITRGEERQKVEQDLARFLEDRYIKPKGADVPKNVDKMLQEEQWAQMGELAKKVAGLFQPSEEIQVAQNQTELLNKKASAMERLVPKFQQELDTQRLITDEIEEQVRLSRDAGEGTSVRQAEFSTFVGSVSGGPVAQPINRAAVPGGGAGMASYDASNLSLAARSGIQSSAGATSDQAIPLLSGILDAVRQTAFNTSRSQQAVVA